jgi:hypothetical protein
MHRLEVKRKERRNISERLAQDFIKGKCIYINANPLTKVLGLHATTRFYIQKDKMENYKKAESTPPQHFAPWQKKA